MVKKFIYRSYIYEHGRFLHTVTLDIPTLSVKTRLIRLLKNRDGFVYDRKSRSYVRYENGLIIEYVTIRK